MTLSLHSDSHIATPTNDFVECGVVLEICWMFGELLSDSRQTYMDRQSIHKGINTL